MAPGGLHMTTARQRSGWCWFGATAFALAAVLLVLSAVDVSAGVGWSLPGYLRLVLAGGALAGMGALMSLAFRIERRD